MSAKSHLFVLSMLTCVLVAPVHAQRSTPVTVVNPPTSPLPVSPQGTVAVQGDVVVTNAPDVNVQSLPPVALDGTPTVVIGNGFGEEIPVRDAGGPALQPWHATVNIDLASDQASDRVIFPNVGLGVPAGKRLVIETVTAQAIVPRDQTPFVTLTLAVEGLGVNGFMQAFPVVELTRMGAFDGVRDRWVATHAVRLYANQVSVNFSRAPGFAAPASLTATVSGHLVDL